VAKERLDVLLVRQGLMESREKAKAAVMAGWIFGDGQRLDKPGMALSADVCLEVKGEQPPFVSRGGLKLAKALQVFPLSFAGAVMADIGASAGGFTDCALQNGAARVYAIDVGYGQLHWKLRTDPRVVVLERTNARYLEADSLPESMDWIVTDVSFISLTKIFPAVQRLLKVGGQVVALIKPQFEAGRESVGKRGVVKDPQIHAQVLENILTAATGAGFQVRGLSYSPIRGPEGNIEYLAWLEYTAATEDAPPDWKITVAEVVQEAQKGAL
jgi:23S rRNA (cytidine1920-2'-O)/16S rRNA (cytidine1409-2'-O)-methyltransferase